MLQITPRPVVTLPAASKEPKPACAMLAAMNEVPGHTPVCPTARACRVVRGVACNVIIQHLLELLMIQSDKLAYLTDLSGSRGRTSGDTALSAHSEEHEVF